MSITPATTLAFSTASVMVTKFPIFSKFPKNIRLLIWEQGINNLSPMFVALKHDFGSMEPGRFKTETLAVTPALYVNKEARKVARKTYRVMFSDVDIPSKPTYFNLNRDSLMVCGDGYSSISTSDDFTLVKHMIAYFSRMCNIPRVIVSGSSQLISHLLHYEGLETLSIVDPLHDFDQSNHDEEHYETIFRVAMAMFWHKQMNPKQNSSGKAVTEPPRIFHLDFKELSGLYEPPDTRELFLSMIYQLG